jgi:hypothetical protein
VLIHELSHWLIGKNWLFVNRPNYHGKWFLAMQIKMYGNIVRYENSACFMLDQKQNGYTNEEFLDACEIFNIVNKSNMNVDDFAEELTNKYNDEHKKSIRYKLEMIALSIAIGSWIAFIAYQII